MMGDIESFVMDRFAEMNFSMPGIVDSFDPTTQRISASVAIKKMDGEKVSQLVDVPVVFPRYGGYAVTMPIKAGDECILIFSFCFMDNWQKGGGIAEQDEFRMNDLSDAIAIVGLNNDGRPLPTYNNTDLEVRNEDASTKIAIKQDQRIEMTTPVECIVNAPKSIFNGDVEINGDTVANGNVEINGDTTANGNVDVVGDVTVDGMIDATQTIHADVDVTTNDNSLNLHTHQYSPGGGTPTDTSNANTT